MSVWSKVDIILSMGDLLCHIWDCGVQGECQVFLLLNLDSNLVFGMLINCYSLFDVLLCSCGTQTTTYAVFLLLVGIHVSMLLHVVYVTSSDIFTVVYKMLNFSSLFLCLFCKMAKETFLNIG